MDRQLLLVDTEVILMHLIHQTKKGAIKVLEYKNCKTYQGVVMQLPHKAWTAWLLVEHGDHLPISASISLKKQGIVYGTGFIYRHKSPILFEYARDFCTRIRNGYDPKIQELLKEALPDLKL